ncbi:hypothetical protein D9758_010510 [Tetrapyrgos nigripes]|uniref:F-box domain-containing protein n=1 Tax=Tetrapyrgos nigripes TaxID=182062 RepID=A0A8H5FVR0_9AGAR|nr:hypothetical protein D9758_010510 [Tetrapyrgos nigripes]
MSLACSFLRCLTSNLSIRPNLPPLPLDILGEITFFLDTPSDKLNLCLASKTVYNYLLPYLYWSLEIYDTKQCLDCVAFLNANSHLARYVRALILHPNYLRMANKKRLLSEVRLADEVTKLIPHLNSLEKFVWDGLEVPRDIVWVALQDHCPYIKFIGTNLGCRDLTSDSKLFAFRDLTGFSLTTELRDSEFRPSPIMSGESLPDELWVMLIEHCPNLRSLLIGHRGAMHFSRRQIDVSPILPARWPQLQFLTMENCVVYGLLESLDNIEHPRAHFTAFVQAHPKLTHLHLKGLPSLDIDNRTPPFALKSYGAALECNPYLAISSGSLREMSLTQKDYSGVFFKYIRHVLSVNPNVRKLTLSMNFSRENALEEDGVVSEFDHVHELKSMAATCKHLEDLTVICSTRRKETFFYKEFPEVLVGTSIKRVELWKYHRAGDETPINLAMRIAREHPSMERIVIRTLHQLWDKEHDPLRILQVGSYKVIRDSNGKARKLLVNEVGGETMSWMLTKKCSLTIDYSPKWQSLLENPVWASLSSFNLG